MTKINNHHLLFDRVTWRAKPETKDLRERHGMIVPLDVEVHRELHCKLSVMPVLDRYMASFVHKHFTPTTDPVDNIDWFNFAVETAIAEMKRVDPVQKEIGRLLIYGMELQKPYVKEGWVSSVNSY